MIYIIKNILLFLHILFVYENSLWTYVICVVYTK